MTRLQMWACFNLGVVVLSLVVFAALLAVAGGPAACTAAGLLVFVLMPGVLLLFRWRGGRLRLALDERDEAVLNRAFRTTLVILLLVVLAGGIGIAATGGHPLALGGFLLATGYVTMVTLSVRVLTGAAQE